ncbi:aminoacyl-tRNA hydrolase [Streptomyces sp. CB01881]|uniref:aminoacyl-tRNA hydrolase n=1 Tax=Streptomyces sp. CB01881 TaxID=2078691 RepID=UPI000CDC92B9|nr:aminoacyl-tRNA hydrolase [Streptomyces sp. CB01881]AUY52279.1 aminoacyl-tRNA hydrolase [Streptomyces sp. CB01881]TYC71701.1 aminoacyl-tRNA hydrolase [Streptomyces sp. CB01881]
MTSGPTPPAAAGPRPPAAGTTWVVAGLGNPGPWFRRTRHNAGFLVVDRLAERHGARFRLRGLGTRVAEIEVEGRRVVLAKPQWFINLSGRPVAGLLRRHGVPAERLLVVQDDLDFPFGAGRLKRGGGPGGHNGARSVTNALGTRDYVRLRFGVGRPPKGQTIGNFVLQEFSADEQAGLPALLDRCAEAAETLVVRGLNRAQDMLHAPAPA